MAADSCLACGTAFQEGMSYCMTCGAPRPQSTPCPTCRSLPRAGIAFCEHCGADLAASDPRGQTQPRANRSRPGAMVAVVLALLAVAAAGSALGWGRSPSPPATLGVAPPATATTPSTAVPPDPAPLPPVTTPPPDDEPAYCEPVCPPVPDPKALAQGGGAFPSLVQSNDWFWASAFGEVTGGQPWWPVDPARIDFVCPDGGSIDPRVADLITCPPGGITTDSRQNRSLAVAAPDRGMVATGHAPKPGQTGGFDLIVLDAGAITAGWADFYNTTMMFVLAHEYAHLVQYRLGLYSQRAYSTDLETKIAYELQADCFAGAQISSIAGGREAGAWTLSKGTRFFDMIGGGGGDHGTGEERAEAFRRGFDDTARACMTYTPFYDLERAFSDAAVDLVRFESTDDLSGLSIMAKASGSDPIDKICVYFFLPDDAPLISADPAFAGPNGQLAACSTATLGSTAEIVVAYVAFPLSGGTFQFVTVSYSGDQAIGWLEPEGTFSLRDRTP